MKNKLVIFLSSILLGVSSIFVPLFNKGTNSARAITSSDTTSYVTVNELWDSANQKVNKDNLLTLFDYVTGTLNSQYNQIEKLAENKLTSKDMRANALSSYNGSSIKEEGKDIVVTLGGLKWQVVYLSENKNGEPILTLMLANTTESGITNTRFATFRVGDGNVDPSTLQNPSSLYGTSYIRSVVLNNGGLRAISDTNLIEVEQDNNNVFANFTMPIDGKYNDITDFITTPVNVEWQEFQRKKDYNVGTKWSIYNLSNEAWSNDLLNDGFEAPQHNFAGRTYNDVWKNDYIWLPSWTELGGELIEGGVWELSQAQKQAQLMYFTRTVDYSAYTTNAVLSVGANGVSSSDPWSNQNYNYSVRPALHLNLSAMMESFVNQEETSNKTIYLDTVNGNDDATGLTEYMAVKSLDVAINKVEDGGEINVMNTIVITEDCVLGHSKEYTLKRYYKNETKNYQGTMFEIGVYDSADTANNKRPTVVFEKVIVDGNSIGKNNFYAHNGVIDVINGNVCFEDNAQYVNHNGEKRDGSTTGVGYGIELYNGSNITINGGLFDNNYNVHYGTLVNNKSNGKIVINGGTFTNNHTLYWGLFYGGTIEINGGVFGGWVDTNEDGIYQTSESLGNTAYNNGILVSCINLTINNGTFHYNIVRDGGGSTAGSLFEANKIVVNSGNFINNYDISSRVNTHGGGVFNVGQSITINGGLFENNNSKRQGGVIYVKDLYNNPTVTIKNAVFKGNYSKIGGVIFSHKAGTTINIENSIFEDNYSDGNKTLTLSDGVAKAYSGGGVIYAIGSNITIKNSTFKNNTSNGAGGAIQNADGGSLNVYDCTFIGNESTGNASGAIHANSFTNIYRSYFEGNKATSNNGGAVSGGHIYDSTFVKNSANCGGAVISTYCTNCEFIENSASMYGGAAHAGQIVSCYFEGNNAVQFAGAISYIGAINSVFINNNTDGKGGAICVDDSQTWYNDASNIIVDNCVFENNSAATYGGSIYVNKGNLKITNSTIVGNTAGTNGGGVYFSSTTGNGKISFGEANKQNKIVIENNTKTGGSADNLFLANNTVFPTIEIISNLEDGSIVCINSDRNLTGVFVAKITGSDKYFTQQTINAFKYQEDYAFYATTITSGSSKTGVGLLVEKISTDNSTLSYTASDNYCDYDGLEHTINIEVYSSVGNYQIFYSDAEDGEYTTTPITVREPGESKIVWFFILDESGENYFPDYREVKISRMDIVVAESITINTILGARFVKNSNLPVTMSGRIVDILGNDVAVDLQFNGNSDIVVGYNHIDSSISVNVIPKNIEKYNTLKNITVKIKIAYDDLYFKDNIFYLYDDLTNSEGSFSTTVASLDKVVSLLNNNATIYFLSPYSITSTMVLQSDNNIYLSRLISNTNSIESSILTLTQSAKVTIGSHDMKGRITITGADSGYSKNASAPLINVNSATSELNIVGNVIIENAKLNKNPTSNIYGAGISNIGKLNLDGTIIRNLYTLGNGGAIYNAGTLTGNNIKVEGCKARVYGAGIYSIGNVTLTNSIIASNIGEYNNSYQIKGVGLSVVGNVNVQIDNCTFHTNKVLSGTNNIGNVNEANRALGGAIYFADGVNANINNSFIQSNLASYGSGLYAGADTNVILTNTNLFNNSTYFYGSAIYVLAGGYVHFVSGEMYINQFNSSSAAGTVITYGTFDFGELGSDNAKINGDTSSSYRANGAAVYVSGNGVFNMYGGIIQGFFSDYTLSTIFVNTNAKAYIYSGKLLYNAGENYGSDINANYQIKGEIYLNTRVMVNNRFSVILNTDKSAKFHLFGDAKDLFALNFKYCGVKNAAGQFIEGKIFDYDVELSGKALTEEEWEYIISKVTWDNTALIGSSTVEYVYDPVLNEYYCYLNSQKATNTIYFSPKTGNNSNDGSSGAKAVLTWDRVLALASTGSTVYLCETWEISADTVINGAGITLSRASSVTTYMFNITTANVTLTINNLILDGRKHYNNAVYADEYLLAKAVIYSEKNCTINLNDTTIQNNATATSGTAIHLKVNANNTNFNLNLNKVKITNNTIYTTAKGKYMGVGIYVENTTATHTSPQVKIDIKNSEISNNTIINAYQSPAIGGSSQLTDTTHYSVNNINGGVGVAFNLTYDANSQKSINFNAYNTSIEGNKIYGATYYGGVALLVFASGTGNNTNVVNITTEKCEFINNGTDYALSNGVAHANSGAINFYTGDSVKINANFNNTNFYNNIGYTSVLYMTTNKEGNSVNFKGCQIDNSNLKITPNRATSIVYNAANNTVKIEDSSITNAQRFMFLTSNNTSKVNLEVSNCSFENLNLMFYLSNVNCYISDVKAYNSSDGFQLSSSNIYGSNVVLDKGANAVNGTTGTTENISGLIVSNYDNAILRSAENANKTLTISDLVVYDTKLAIQLAFGDNVNLGVDNTNNNIINIKNCLLYNCTSGAIKIKHSLYTTTSTGCKININVSNTTIKNCKNGFYTEFNNSYTNYIETNLNLTNTTIDGCTYGFYNTYTPNAKTVTVIGGHFINNGHGLYATARLDLKKVVAVNNSTYDVYAGASTHIGGKNNIGTMYCVTTTSTTSILLTSSISGSAKTTIKTNVDVATGLMIIGVDTGYTPTTSDFNGFVNLFKIDGATLSASGLSIVVSALQSAETAGEFGSVAQTNVYYFDPENKTGHATLLTNGRTINEPFSSLLQVLLVADSDVTVYVMSKVTLTGTHDFKGMTFKVYFNNAGVMPYITSGVIFTTSSTAVIKNLIIDGNRNNENTTNGLDYYNQTVTVAGRVCVPRIIGSTNGNITLENFTLQNLYTTETYPLHFNGVPAVMKNCKFYNIYTTGIGMYMGSTLEAKNCEFINVSRCFFFNNNLQKTLEGCYFENCNYIASLQNAQKINITDCEFFNCKQVITLYSNIYSSDIKYEDCLFSDCGYVLYATKLSKSRNTNAIVKEMKFDLAVRNNITFDGCEIYKTKTCAIYAESEDNIWFNAMINVVDTAIIGCDGEKLIHANNVRFNFENSVLSGAKYGFYIIDGYANFSKYTEVNNCEYGLYVTTSAQVTCDGVVIENNQTGVYTDAHFTLNGGIISGNSICAINSNSASASITITGGLIDASNGLISSDYGGEENLEYSIYTPGKIYISGNPIITAPIIANGFANSNIIDYGENFKIVNNSEYPFKLENGDLINGNRGVTNRKVSSIEFIALRNATLSFDWISNSENSFDYFEVVYNNEQKIYRTGTGMTATQHFSQAMEAGDIVKLVYYKDTSTNSGTDGPVISNLSCMSDFTKSLQATSSTISATRDTTSNYYATTSAAYTFVERSDGAIVNPNSHIISSVADYKIVATKAFNLNFSYFVAAEANCDWFTITYNSTQKVRINSTNGAFTNFSQAMNVGDTLTFTYSNDTRKTDKSNVVVIKGLKYIQPVGSSTSGTIAAPTILLGELNANSIVRFVVPKNVGSGDAIASAFGGSFDNAKAQNLAKAVYVDGWADTHYVNGSKAGVTLSAVSTTQTVWNQDFSSTLYFDPNNSTSNAKDTNSGRSYADPLKTWAAVESKNADGKYNVVIMSNWVIKNNTTIDLHGKTLSKYYINDTLRFDKNDKNPCIIVDNGSVLTINNTNINGNYKVNGKDACINSEWGFIHVKSGGKLIYNNGTAYNNYNKSRAGGIIRAETADVVLNNVRFENNYANGGGVIYATGGNLTINNCWFEGNSIVAQNFGGAIYFINSTTTGDPKVLTITNSTFKSNKASFNTTSSNNFGGAIYAKTNVAINIDNCLFYNNSARFNGGALYFEAVKEVNILNSIFDNNRVESNGYKGNSICYDKCVNGSSINIDGCLFKNHTASTQVYGVIYIDSAGDVAIRNTEVCYNYTYWRLINITNGINTSSGSNKVTLENLYLHENKTSYRLGSTDSTSHYGTYLLVQAERANDIVTVKNCVFRHNINTTPSGSSITYTNFFYFNIKKGTLNFDNNLFKDNACLGYLTTITLGNSVIFNNINNTYIENQCSGSSTILFVKLTNNNVLNFDNLIVENNIANRMVHFYEPDSGSTTNQGHTVNYSGGSISENRKCGGSDSIGFAIAIEAIDNLKFSGVNIKNNFNLSAANVQGELSIYNSNGYVKDVYLTGNTLQGGALRFGSSASLTNNLVVENAYIANNRNTIGGLSGKEFSGAGIYAREYANLQINNSIIENNTTKGYLGTGILGANSKITLNNTIVRNNYNWNTTTLNVVTTLIKTNVNFNDVSFDYTTQSTYGGGGGIAVYGGNLTVNGGEIYNNSSTGMAGGIMAYAPVLLNGTKVYNNASKLGGGMVLTSDSTIINSEIYDNYASDYAGAIWLGAKLTILNSKVYNNRTEGDGAGIYTELETSSLVIDGVVFKNNTSLGSGAGVYFENPLGTITLNNSEFIGNTSEWYGTAIYSEVEVNIKNTKFVANNINGCSLIHYGFIRSATLENVVISGNFGYGEEATLFSFDNATSTGIPRFNIVNSSIYGNLTQKKALIEITNNLYLSILESNVYGNVNSGEDGKGGLISVVEGTFKLENGQLSNNFAANGASVYFAENTSGLFMNSVITGHSNGLSNYCQNGAVYIDTGADVKFIGGEVKDNFASNLNGVIYNNGLLEMTGTNVYNNQTNVGSIYNASAGIASFEDVNIYDNTANKGAGIANFGILNFISGAIVNNTAVDVVNPDETITYGEGGGVYNGDTGIFTLTSGEISSNSAGHGGGVYNNGQFILNNGRVSSNTMTHSGGGIYNYISGQLTINDGFVVNNTPKEGATSTSGFGIANAGSMVMNGGEISNNYTLTSSASYASSKGGAIYGFTTSSHTRLIGGKVVDNAAELGAGIYLESGAVLDVYDITLDNETRLINAKHYGRAIYSNSSTINLIDTIVKSSASFNPNNCYGSIYTQDSNVNIRGCEFISNKENYGIITCIGGSLKIVDTLFNQNKTTYDVNTVSGIINLEGVNKFEFEDCEFISNQTNGSGLLRIKITGKFTGLIDNCLFDGNTASKDGGAIAIFSEVAGANNSELTISNSTFVNNSAGNNGGALYINGANGATINLLNTVFGGWIDLDEDGEVGSSEKRGNTATNNGGAIYIAENTTSPVSVVIKGEIEVSYNNANVAGGIYYAYANSNNTAENYYNLHLQSGLFAYIKHNGSSRGESNLYIVDTADLNILSTGLVEGSEIGVSLVKNGGSKPNVGDAVIKSYKNNLPLNTGDFKAFYYDMGAFGLKLDAAQNQIVLASVSYQGSIVVNASDIVYGLDGKYKTVTTEDIKVIGSSDYTVTFAKEENGVYSENAPRYMAKGEYTIWYKVVNNSRQNEEVKGSLKLKITGKILVVKEAPTVYLNKDETLSQATFKGGMAISNGSSVSGTWAFADGNIKPSDTTQKYKLVFTPFNDDIYENEASIYVNVNISYYKVYYYSDATVSGFFTDREHLVPTGIKSLSEMVNCMQENGVIYFITTYTVGSTGVTEENVLSNNKIFMARYALHKDTPIISLPTNASTLKLSLGGGSGEIIIEARHGYAAFNETAPLFENYGILILNSNVSVSGFTNTAGEASVVKNYGQLYLNGTQIYNNMSTSTTTNCKGSAIANYGEDAIVYFNGGDYRLNRSQGNTTYTCFGGFMYNEGGIVIVNGGFFVRNGVSSASYPTNGGFLYTDGGSVVINGGDIMFNYAHTGYGGAIYATNGAEIKLNGGNILINFASKGGAGIYIAENTSEVIINGGEIKFNVLSTVSIDNNEILSNNNQKTDIVSIIVNVLVMIICLNLVVFSVYFYLPKNKKFKIKNKK
ncbi:MAG: right-handed parallel beta-helix repeat-containing protein [Clostridia bacterium]|nr:right-handed parallel beta-helix repeat-containing protein [Clostridia bacterium]